MPEVCLGGRVQLDEEKRLRLDQVQTTILESLEENNRLLIKGAAGTGKTLLACETVLREARKGKWLKKDYSQEPPMAIAKRRPLTGVLVIGMSDNMTSRED